MTTRSQLIVRLLREGILEGEYSGGTHMNEIELAAALGVSRTPIRAALSILAAEGLLHYTPNSGFVVQKFTSSDIEAIFDVRATLSGMAARLAAQRGLSAEALEKLHALVAQAKGIIDHREWTPEVRQAWQDHNERFHGLILSSAGNSYLEMALRRTRDIPVLKEIRFRWIDPDQLNRNHYDHVQIVDALERRQQERAEYLTREHIYQNGQRIVRQWRQIEIRKHLSDGIAASDLGEEITGDGSGPRTIFTEM